MDSKSLKYGLIEKTTSSDTGSAEAAGDVILGGLLER